jgi:hypothetical protein
MRALENSRPPSDLRSDPSTESAQVFDALAQAKILVAQVAMHLGKDERHRLFAQLDSLHDVSEWESGDKPIERTSFATFIKLIVLLKPEVRPALGLAHSGNVIASWTKANNRLTMECFANDTVRWTLSRRLGERTERAAGESVVVRIADVLAPYQPERWFSRGEQ